MGSAFRIQSKQSDDEAASSDHRQHYTWALAYTQLDIVDISRALAVVKVTSEINRNNQ